MTVAEVLSCPFCGYAGKDMAWCDLEGIVELIEHPNTDCVLADLRCEDPDMWNARELEL